MGFNMKALRGIFFAREVQSGLGKVAHGTFDAPPYLFHCGNFPPDFGRFASDDSQ